MACLKPQVLSCVLIWFAMAIFSTSATSSSNDVYYHGGKVMVDPITLYIAWIGPWSEFSKEVIRDSIRSLSDPTPSEFPTLFNWWKVLRQYTDSNNRPVSSNVTVSETECSVDILSGTTTATELAVSEKCNSVLPDDENGIYHAVIYRDFITMGYFSCSGQFRNTSTNRTYLWTRQPQADEFCNLWNRFGAYAGPPNGDTGLDSLISAVLASSAEAATNGDAFAWKDATGGTVSSKCPSPTGRIESRSPVIEDGGISWNIQGVNGSRYMVQQLWSQASNNCALQTIENCKYMSTLDEARGFISQGLILKHRVGLQPYSPGLYCHWYLSTEMAKVIRLTVNFMDIGVGDVLNLHLCPQWNPVALMFGYKSPCSLLRSMTGTSSGISLPDLFLSDLTLEFKTSRKQTPLSMGWEIEYKTGFCYEDLIMYDRSGHISDGTPKGLNYLGKRKCKWLLMAKKGTAVHLQFTRFDTTQGRDFLTIYREDERRVSILDVFSGSYLVLPNRTYIGPILLVFWTQTDNGSGWAADFSMDHPETEGRSMVSNKNLVAVILGALSGMICLISGVWLVLRSCAYKSAFNKATKQFTRAELDAAANYFSKANLVAPEMFAGVLSNGQPVTIQRLMTSCVKEYELLARIKHPNVASILGVCYDINESFLVFKNMPRGSVSSYLFCDSKCSALSWERRVKIVTQVAKALGYLHAYADPCVVHCAVSSSNIYLDSSWNPKLGGFGNALAVSPTSPQEHKLKAEDVYKMGILILELLMGQSAWKLNENHPTAGARLAVHVIDAGSGYMILDKRLKVPCERQRTARALMKVAEIGAWCMNERAEDRPNMMEVAALLSQVEAIYFGNSKRHSKRLSENS